MWCGHIAVREANPGPKSEPVPESVCYRLGARRMDVALDLRLGVVFAACKLEEVVALEAPSLHKDLLCIPQ